MNPLALKAVFDAALCWQKPELSANTVCPFPRVKDSDFVGLGWAMKQCLITQREQIKPSQTGFKGKALQKKKMYFLKQELYFVV